MFITSTLLAFFHVFVGIMVFKKKREAVKQYSIKTSTKKSNSHSPWWFLISSIIISMLVIVISSPIMYLSTSSLKWDIIWGIAIFAVITTCLWLINVTLVKKIIDKLKAIWEKSFLAKGIIIGTLIMISLAIILILLTILGL